MNTKSNISSCANPECRKKFVRFGEGKLYVFHVADPEEWGLPSHATQKVLWLCEKCRASFFVRLDRRKHIVQILRKAFIQKAG